MFHEGGIYLIMVIRVVLLRSGPHSLLRGSLLRGLLGLYSLRLDLPYFYSSYIYSYKVKETRKNEINDSISAWNGHRQL